MRKIASAFALTAMCVSSTVTGGVCGPSFHRGVNDVNHPDIIKDKMIEELDMIKAQFDVGYAPKEWKYGQSGWDLDEQIELAKDRVYQHPKISVKAYQRIVRDFFHSTHDYHVGILFYSTEMATLPFSVASADGTYFITQIDRSKLSYNSFPFSVGDEIVEFDGRSIHEVVEELRKTETRDRKELTDQALAEVCLTARLGMLGQEVPQGSIIIGAKNHNGNIVRKQLIWDYIPELIANPTDQFANAHSVKHSAPALTSRKSTRQLVEQFVEMTRMEPAEVVALQKHVTVGAANPHEIGARRSFLPELGRVVWESDEDSVYHAYMYLTPNRDLIGYIRIPHYTTLGSEDFAELIESFEEKTDMLVIDQFNNPGGYLFEVYALVSMLTDRPIEGATKQQYMISHGDVLGAMELLYAIDHIKTEQQVMQELGDEILGYPIDLQFVNFMRSYCQFIIDQWNQGKSPTDAHHYFGVEQINPHPTVHYSKPILLLINHLNFSGGDFFPALLQDGGRAVTLGTQTAGAGGYVQASQFPNRFGVNFIQFTGSIAVRPDGQPIEDLGVTPDIEYKLTREDLQGNFGGLVEAIQSTVKSMVK